MGHYIGIDMGTSSVKLVLTDEQGHIIAEASQEYRLLQPAPGWKEIEADTWWGAVEVSLDALLAGQDRSRIRAIGITGQMHSLVLLGEDGAPVRPVLMWNDTRTKELIPELKEKISKSTSAHIAKIISTGSPASNLYWTKLYESETFHKTRHFLIGPDYLVYRFTGVIGTDYCEASTSSLYDLGRRDWSDDVLRIIGADRSICPPVRGSAEIAGKITASIAKRFALPEEVKVITGTGDNPAASLPTGCLTGGYPVLSLGTSAVLMFPRSEPCFDVKGKNILFSIDGETVYTLTQGALQSCGSGYNWLVRDIMQIGKFGGAERGINRDRLGRNAIMFYPHLVGDKTIYQDPTLRGAFIGLGTETTRDDMIQAYMEGIAFAVRQLSEEMGLGIASDRPCNKGEKNNSISVLRTIGGGSKSDIWMQILADVLGIRIMRMEGNPGAGFGMAMLAGYALGEVALPQVAGGSMQQGCVFEPDEDRSMLYEAEFRRYLRIHDALKMIG